MLVFFKRESGYVLIFYFFFFFSNNGTDKDGFPIFYVSVHEIGHILTLDHINDTKSIMYKTFIGVDQEITEIDRARAQAKWGRRSRKESEKKSEAGGKMPTMASSEKNGWFIVLTFFAIIVIISVVFLIIAGIISLVKKEWRTRG